MVKNDLPLSPKMTTPMVKNDLTPMVKNDSHNNTSINSTDNNTIINYIKIGQQKFMLKPSEIAEKEFQISIGELLASALRGVDKKILLAEMDMEYVTGYEFSDRNHFMNSLKKLGRDILSGKRKLNGTGTQSGLKAKAPVYVTAEEKKDFADKYYKPSNNGHRSGENGLGSLLKKRVNGI